MQIATLIALYRSTHYDVRLNGGRRITLRVGSDCPDLPIESNERWGFITAWNPFSEPRPASDNRAAQRELFDALKRSSRVLLPAVGRIPGEPWREPALFAGGISLDELDRLARTFRQNAIVTGRGHGVGSLRFYRDDWRHAITDSDIEMG